MKITGVFQHFNINHGILLQNIVSLVKLKLNRRKPGFLGLNW